MSSIIFACNVTKVEQLAKYIYRHHNIMILCIQHGHFGKVARLFHCIPVDWVDGISIENL